MPLRKGLTDPDFIRKYITAADEYAHAHGAYTEDEEGNWDTGYLGWSMLYYTFVYMLEARTAVCMGSGDGFVPRLMRQAQRDLGIADESSTILIDAGVYESHEYRKEHSFVRNHYPDIEICTLLSVEAGNTLFGETGRRIDVLHIDTSHTYATVKQQWLQYRDYMAPFSIITMHDTQPRSFGVGKWYMEMVRDFADHQMECVNWPVRAGLGVCFIHPQTTIMKLIERGYKGYRPPRRGDESYIADAQKEYDELQEWLPGASKSYYPNGEEFIGTCDPENHDWSEAEEVVESDHDEYPEEPQGEPELEPEEPEQPPEEPDDAPEEPQRTVARREQEVMPPKRMRNGKRKQRGMRQGGKQGKNRRKANQRNRKNRKK